MFISKTENISSKQGKSRFRAIGL